MPRETEMTDLYAALDKMDADELRQVQKRVEGLISDYQDSKRREAISSVEQVAKDHGFKLADLVADRQAGRGAKPGASKSSAPVKYMNPDDPQQTWSGLGRRPGWVRAALDSGRTLDDLAL